MIERVVLYVPKRAVAVRVLLKKRAMVILPVVAEFRRREVTPAARAKDEFDHGE
jgi:hypothetical protein